MRLLKFRVWDKELNKFDSPNVHHLIKNNAILSIGLNLDIQKICGDGRFVIQQYTGLKDKNGEEIYEGDIVKATSDQYENENFVGKVIFDEGCFLTWINKNDIRGIWGEDDIEVIGNIFETPELLEKL